MKNTPSKNSLTSRLHALFNRYPKIINGLANGFSITTGLAWLVSVVPSMHFITWSAVAGLATMALVLVSYRSFEITKSLNDTRQAFDQLFRITSKQHLELLGDFFAKAQISGNLPVTHLAAYMTTMKQFSNNPEQIDEILDLIRDFPLVPFSNGSH